jgi:hypothetical protein
MDGWSGLRFVIDIDFDMLGRWQLGITIFIS